MNLLDVLKSTVANSGNFDAIKSLLGENKQTTQRGLDAALPAVLGHIAQKASTTEGANNLLKLLKDGGHDGNVLGNLAGILKGGFATTNLLQTGDSLINSTLGDKTSMITRLLTIYSGLKSKSSSSLLSLAAPLVMGAIGQEVKAQNLSAPGLMSLLSSQTESVKKELPYGSGIGSTLGFDKGSNKVSLAGISGGFMKFLPYLLAGIGLLFLFSFWKACSSKPTEGAVATVTNAVEATANTTTAVIDSTMSKVGQVADSLAATTQSAAATVAEATNIALPNGPALNVEKGSLEDKMVTFIQSKEAVDKDVWFDFEHLLFQPGKATLKSGAQEQLQNVAAIMKAYPKVNIKIGGYTDNVGSATSNMKLSDSRAKNVMAELVASGVEAGRMTAEGYGKEHPVASNKTAEGRAKNRRISISVRSK